jgi:uncharacterized OB-fold protein
MTYPESAGTELTPEVRFWQIAAQGEVRFQRCTDCGAWRHPPVEVCHACLSSRYSWEGVSGRATLLSYVVVHTGKPRGRTFPYWVGHAELDEGIRYSANILGIAAGEIRVGMPLQLVSYADDGGEAKPQFVARASAEVPASP